MKRTIVFVLMILMLTGVLPTGSMASGLPTIYVLEEVAVPGETVILSVGLKNNPGIACFELTVDYDASQLAWVDVSENTELDGSWDAAVGETILWVNADNYAQDGEVFSLTFEVLDSADVGYAPVTISYKSGEIFDENEVDVHFVVEAGGVMINTEGADINKDGETNALDVICLMKHIVGLAELDTTDADINTDDTVDVLDVIRLIRYLAGENVQLY